MKHLILLSAAVGLLNGAALAQDQAETLFQNRFFTLSKDNQLLCATSEQAFLPPSVLRAALQFYERGRPHLRAQAVAVLTDHKNPQHLEDLADYRADCQSNESPDLCVLEKYWGDTDAALRALALFYDTKTIVKHSEDYRYQIKRFSEDHIRAFEKAVRKIPGFLRQSISKAKPIDKLAQEIADKPRAVQNLIREAYQDDYDTSIWQDYTHPLTLVPGIGFRSQTVAQVFSGQNLIVFTVSAFDKGKEGTVYRDINAEYLVDFRLPIAVHEIAHTIDNFHFWNGTDDLYFFYKYHKMSNDQQIMQIVSAAQLALWPSKWFEAFEYLHEVNAGRYDGSVQEKLAELVAQYILIPERLKISAPQAYQWLRHEVFRDIEYQGYDSCPQPVIRPLSWWQQYASGKILGR
ncbi:hypothetical protein [Methylomonas rhizoryzae]|uniref:hypothetical protein n=1 Tax=Methylomonas rhizoryzae TaxID=2608981 RepID=UPI001231E006|nr:hypothetical protein [Methylomonas rhizoryzae]